MDEWELRTDMLTGAIRLVCVRGKREGLIYEWRDAAHMAAVHEAGLVDKSAENERLRVALLKIEEVVTRPGRTD